MPEANNPTSSVPVNRTAFGLFVNEHVDGWALDGPAVGLDGDRGTRLTTRLAAYNAAVAQRVQGDEGARAGLAALDAAEKDLRTECVGAVRTIRSYASTQPDPTAVYNTAKLAAPRPATPRPVPAAPTGLKATLEGTGDLKVNWKPVAGSAYAVQRKLTDAAGQTTAFVDLVTDGARPFVDTAVPAGTTVASYRVRARRSGKTGPWSDSANVLFVANRGGGAAELRIAA